MYQKEIKAVLIYNSTLKQLQKNQHINTLENTLIKRMKQQCFKLKKQKF